MIMYSVKNYVFRILNEFFSINPVDEPRPVVIDSYDTELLSNRIAKKLDGICKMKVKINHDNEQLYCVGCKRLIELGEKYIIVQEDYLGDLIEKVYCWECVPEDPEEDIYLIGDDNE